LLGKEILQEPPRSYNKHTTSRKRYSVYCREALYIHCHNDFFCKISVTDSKYQVIKAMFPKNFKIPRHIECLDTCIEY
jgi:hypothetical protein